MNKKNPQCCCDSKVSGMVCRIHYGTNDRDPSPRSKIKKRNKVSEVLIGEFRLIRAEDGKLWLSHENGEAMQMNEENESAFESMVDAFWKVNF